MPGRLWTFDVWGKPAGSCEGLWTERRDDIEDVPVLAAAGLHADQACGEAEVGATAASDRRDPGSGSHRACEATA